MAVIDTRGIHYKDLNEKVKELVEQDEMEIILNNVCGQRYIGTGLTKDTKITINGIPGNDMAAFASNIEIIVQGNIQDATANTMDGGKIVVHGDARDVLGYGIRGGEIYIKGNAGYRVGIHMKGYQNKQPTIIIGGTAGDFLGEYMAGGRLVLLGLECKEGTPIAGSFIGTGMHGGVIYIRRKIENYQVGLEVAIKEVDKSDRSELRELLTPYCREFDLNIDKIMDSYFSKLIPLSSRPYGNLYAY